MNSDRDSNPDAAQAARRERGRRLAWIAVGVGIVAMLSGLGPAPATAVPDATRRLLDQAAPAVAQHVASLSSEIDWSAIEAAPDPAPLAVAAYER